jgi:predicted nucleotidyltransferase
MGLDQVSADIAQVARAAAGIIHRMLTDRTYGVLLFGSWASGSAGERSDIDIGIVGPTPVDASVLCDIRDAVEKLPTIYTIDIVDLQRVGPDFRSAMMAGAIEVEGAA